MARSPAARSRPGAAIVALLLAATCSGQRPAPRPTRFEGDLRGLERVSGALFRRGDLFRRPGVDLGAYRALYLAPVELAADLETEDHRYRERDLAWLERALNRNWRHGLEGPLPFADAPGPGALRLRFLLTAVRANALPLDQSRLGSGPTQSTTRSFGVGSAAMQLELRDAETGELLLAAVDRYRGEELSTNPRARETWGDAEYAVRRWASWLRRMLEGEGAPAAS